MKKTLIILLCLTMAIFAAACDGQSAPAGSVPDFSVEAIATAGDEAGTVADLFCAILDAEETPYELQDGRFISINKYANTAAAGWVFYIDGTPSDAIPGETAAVGGTRYELIWGDIISENSGDDTEENTGDETDTENIADENGESGTDNETTDPEVNDDPEAPGAPDIGSGR